jgi:hypothetical protein
MLARTPWRLMAAPRTIYSTARELARPVARGDLPLTQALAGLVVETLQQERSGALGTLRAPDVMGMKRFLLNQEVDRLQIARDLAAWQIKRLITPMLAAHRPSREVLAEAHGLNGGADFPLTEAEVTDVVRCEMFYAMPPAPRERRYGR